MAMSPISFLYIKCLVASARNLGCLVFLRLFPWLVVACALVVGLFYLFSLFVDLYVGSDFGVSPPFGVWA